MSLSAFVNDRSHVVTKFSRLCPSVREEIVSQAEKVFDCDDDEGESPLSSTGFCKQKPGKKIWLSDTQKVFVELFKQQRVLMNRGYGKSAAALKFSKEKKVRVEK